MTKIITKTAEMFKQEVREHLDTFFNPNGEGIRTVRRTVVVTGGGDRSMRRSLH